MRANFTQENIQEMKKFDPELARKARIAYDHKLPINFQQLEIIEESLPRLLEEKKQLEAARSEVANLPFGAPYELPKSLDVSAVPSSRHKGCVGHACGDRPGKGVRIASQLAEA